MTRFSPTSGTTSASVPIAATLTKPGTQRGSAGAAAERLDELQRDADAGEVLVRVGAVVALRVHHRDGVGQLDVGLVVVGDDEIDAELAGAARGRGAADAAVHRDDDPRAIRLQAIEGGRLQAVAVAQPLGDEMHDIGAEQLERPPQDDGRRDAVHVVVAVDGNALARGNGAAPAASTARSMSASRNGSSRWSSDGARNRLASSRSCRPRMASSRAVTCRDAELPRERAGLLVFTGVGLPNPGRSRRVLDSDLPHRAEFLIAGLEPGLHLHRRDLRQRAVERDVEQGRGLDRILVRAADRLWTRSRR